MAGLGPFRFEWADGPLHRIHPLSKLIVLLMLSWLSLGATLPLAAMLYGLAGLFLALLRARPGNILRNARFLLPIALFVVFVNVVEPGAASWIRPQGLLDAAAYLGRLCLVFLFAEAFFRSTSSGELADGATRLARRLPGASRTDPGFYLSLTLGFIPRSIDAYERCHEAALARGLGLRRRRGGKFRRSLLVLESFVAGSLRSAMRSAAALEARCYSSARSIAPRPVRPSDVLIPIVGFVALLAAILSV